MQHRGTLDRHPMAAVTRATAHRSSRRTQQQCRAPGVGQSSPHSDKSHETGAPVSCALQTRTLKYEAAEKLPEPQSRPGRGQDSDCKHAGQSPTLTLPLSSETPSQVDSASTGASFQSFINTLGPSESVA